MTGWVGFMSMASIGLIIGASIGEANFTKVEPFFVAPFQGVLALFLLEMGMVAGRRLADIEAFA